MSQTPCRSLPAILLSGLSLILAAGGCVPRGSGPGKTAAPKIFRMALPDDPKSLDPANAYDVVSLQVMPYAIESLYSYAFLKEPYEVEPLLADGMPEVSPDGLTVRIKLRKDIRYHDDPAFSEGRGRELRASDFVYAWKRLTLPRLQSPGLWIFEGKVLGFDAYRDAMLKLGSLPKEKRAEAEEKLLQSPLPGFEALDDFTIRVRLTRRFPQLIYVLTTGFTAPVPPEVPMKYGHEALAEKVVGTGPFRVEEFVRNSRVRLTRFAAFRDERYPSTGDEAARRAGLLADAGKKIPFLDELRFEVIREEQPAWLKLLGGELEVGPIPKDSFNRAFTGPAKLAPELEAKGLRVLTREEATLWFLALNMKDPLLGSNLNLRRAISSAIDREKLISLFLNGRAHVPHSIIPAMANGGYPPENLVLPYDPEAARNFLAAAGFPDGKKLPRLQLDLRGTDSRTKQLGEFLERALKDAGIPVEVVLNPLPAFLQKEREGRLQISNSAWSADYLDPENFLQLLYGKNIAPGPNVANWQNAEFDRLFETFSPMATSAARNELVRRAERIAMEQAVWVPLYQPIRYDLAHRRVRNYRPSSIFLNDLKYADLKN